ncbi:MAG TPA: hypothetical protein VES89_07460 [Candidatus Competibacteraceae bacterium]|nr:hypothetical protein [Candidatus Competibacteraceae bacterium]
MKFYRLSWCEPDEGIRYAWHRTRREAEQDARRVRAEWPDVHPEDLDLEITREAVPTTKAKLLRWLNAYACRYC